MPPACGVCARTLEKLTCPSCINESLKNLRSQGQGSSPQVQKAQEKFNEMAESSRLEQQKFVGRKVLEERKKLLEVQRSEVASLREMKVQRELALQKRKQEVEGQRMKLLLSKEQISKIVQDKASVEANLKKIFIDLTEVRKKVCQGISSIYKLDKPTEQKIQIVLHPLPIRIEPHVIPAEILNAALGYMAQIVNLISEKLQVVLPYTINWFGSFSTIHYSKLPLYLNEKESNMADFNVALALFNHDIAYLCFTQGIQLDQSQVPDNLLNLFNCLKSPNFGNPENPHSFLAINPQGPDFLLSIPTSFEERLVVRLAQQAEDDEWQLIQEPTSRTQSDDGNLDWMGDRLQGSSRKK